MAVFNTKRRSSQSAPAPSTLAQYSIACFQHLTGSKMPQFHHSAKLRITPPWAPSRRKAIKLIPAIILIFITLNLLVNRYTSTPSLHGRRRSPKIQFDFGPHPESLAEPARQHAVRREFIHAWTAYSDHGWMSDSLNPLNGAHQDQFCGWSATLVDALDTIYLMGLWEEFDEAVHATMLIEFDDKANDCTVNLFETTIRHLGGLISAYDLSQDSRLLPKLIELGEVLHRAFNTINGMPCSHCRLMSEGPENFQPSKQIAMAAQGSLYLEFARLSQITGNSKYMDSVNHLTDAFVRTQNDSTIPGLWPESVDASSVDLPYRHFSQDSVFFSLGALSDSTYEYLVKSHLMLGQVTSKYADMWRLAVPQIRQYLLFRAQIPDSNATDLIFSGIASRFTPDTDSNLQARIQHLGCFAGGMFAMAGRMFDAPNDFFIGEALTNGCVWAYENSPLGIMPETVTLLQCENDNGTQCAEDPGIWSTADYFDPNQQSGFNRGTLPKGFLTVNDGRYLLRPEAIESVFIMWRTTGDPYWREVGWKMFTTIREHTWSPFGHASLENVMQRLDPETDKFGNRERARQRGEMESFWFAETLKYFYLLFSEPTLVDLDEWVLNTEAHPMKLVDNLRGF